MRNLLRAFALVSLLAPFSRPAAAGEVPFQTGHTHDILSVKFSPDDRRLASYSAGDGSLRLWDVSSGRLLWVSGTEFARRAGEHYNPKEFYWSADGKFFVTRSSNGRHQLWDAEAGKVLSVSDAPPAVGPRAEPSKRLTVTKEPGGFRLFGPGAGERYTVESSSRTGDVYDVSHDGTLFAEGGSWGDAAVRLTELKTGRTRLLVGHPGVVQAISYSPDGRHLAFAGGDRNVYVFDAQALAPAVTLHGHAKPVTSLAFSPDGQTLLSCDEEGRLRAWDWRAGRLLRDLASPTEGFRPRKVAFSPDGRYFLTTGEEEEVFELWDVRAWALVRGFKTPEGYKSGGDWMTVGYDAVPVTAAAFGNDGRTIFSGHADGTLRVWDIGRGRQLRKLRLGRELHFFQVGPGGRTVLAAVGPAEELRIKLFDARTGRVLKEFDDEDTDYTEALALSPDGKHFASSDAGGGVRLWEAGRRRPAHALDIGFSGDDALAFSPDGRTLAAGGRNQNLFLFDTATGRKLWQLLPSYRPGERGK